MPFELSSILLLPDPEIKFIDPTHHYWLANCMAGIKLIHSYDFLLLFLFKDKALNPHSMVLVPWHGLLQLCMWVTEQWSPVVSNTRLTLALLYYPYPDVSLKYHPLPHICMNLHDFPLSDGLLPSFLWSSHCAGWYITEHIPTMSTSGIWIVFNIIECISKVNWNIGI